MSWIKLTQAFSQLPELLFAGKIRFDFDGIPLIAKEVSFQKRINLLKAGIDALFRLNKLHALPPLLQVEPINICNLTCPLCPTGVNSLKRPKGMMTMDTFRQILDELGDVLIAAYLFGYGEPFLHPQMPQMIAACTQRNILTLTTTNGQFIQTIEEALRIVDAGLTTLIIAVDGSTQALYAQYRQGGDLEKAKRCAMLIEDAKAVRNSAFPYTVLRSVIMRQNQDDLPNLELLARNLGVNRFAVKTLGGLIESEQYSNYESTNSALRRFGKRTSSSLKPAHVVCPFPFRQPAIFWDGTVVGSEHDHELEKPLGKIGEQPFATLWNNPQAIQLRRSIREGHDRPAFCTYCSHEGASNAGVKFIHREFRKMI